ncbi:hypothetical protein NEOLI_000714 [Neolecta irregularis DAH-3]|uniref:USP domain-containing protein n=1 Tax=Neolecta irregularis (strain DAH-3) TaxID=1198029 RepID=A0A1U7LWB1_NEOID|nr:hypothetical protein NEOLI_000714 [Neolecta irregularis DAH-3]|eukprot:OLL26908.1 hypothetical protein NEOLI_000714 [Neolecta irregularis DAH-3]
MKFKRLRKTSPRQPQLENEADVQINRIVADIEQLGLLIARDNVAQVFYGPYASRDSEKAKELLMMLRYAEDGRIEEICPSIGMRGAQNIRSSCYLNSLLFVMFAHTDVFEPILYKRFEDSVAHQNMCAGLRLWVNMLRTGKLITCDITDQVRAKLSIACEWDSFDKNSEEDVSEAFMRITEALHMPLLTFLVDYAHEGLEIPNQDHKFEQGRLLNVIVPLGEAKISLQEAINSTFGDTIAMNRGGSVNALKLTTIYASPTDGDTMSSFLPKHPVIGMQLQDYTRKRAVIIPEALPHSIILVDDASRSKFLRLRSVIHHRGGYDWGHYFSYSVDDDCQWWKFDDLLEDGYKVSAIDTKDFLESEMTYAFT